MPDNTNNKSSMPLYSRFAYAFGAFGHDFLYFAISLYLINFISTNLINTGSSEMNSFMVSSITIIMMALGIIEMFFDPLIGNIIDRTKTRWGHFRPWIVIGGFVSSIVLCIMFTDLGGMTNYQSPMYNPYLYLVIFGFMYFILGVFFSFSDISFWSMLPALSLDSKQREKNATFARVGSTFGDSLIGVVVMPIVLFFSLDKASAAGDVTGWFWFGFIVMSLSLVTIIVVAVFTKEKEDPLRENKEETKGIAEIFKVVFKNRQLFWTAVGYVLYCIAVCTVNALELFYFQYIMDYKEGFSILQTINMFVGVMSVFAFPVIMLKFKRKHLFYCCICSMLCGLALFSIAGQQLSFVLIAAELFFIPQPLVFLVVLMTITDSVEYGQLMLGHRDESLTLSIRPLCDKLGGALGNGIVGQTAIAAGMISGASAASITAEGIFAFKILMFAFPALLLLVSLFIFAKKVQLTEEMHSSIINMLNIVWNKDSSSK